MSEDNGFTHKEKIELITKVNDMGEALRDLVVVIRGDSTSDEPTGIMWTTKKNTDFRNNITRWLWILTTLMTAVILERIFSLFS